MAKSNFLDKKNDSSDVLSLIKLTLINQLQIFLNKFYVRYLFSIKKGKSLKSLVIKGKQNIF